MSHIPPICLICGLPWLLLSIIGAGLMRYYLHPDRCPMREED